MEKDVAKFIERCNVCHMAKTRSLSVGLYTPLLVSNTPWEDMSLDFVVGLHKTQTSKDLIMIIVDFFFKMEHFIPCNKTIIAFYVANIYFKKIVRLHEIPRTMVFDMDSKFLSHFWSTLWKKLGTSLKYFLSPQIDS